MLPTNVLITGGTGTLGQAIVARAKRDGLATRFTIFSRDEVKQAEMKARYPDERYVLGSVTDREAIVMAAGGQSAIIHAAAYKQVPAAEVNTREAIHANVYGSQNVIHAALYGGVETVVGISTDKACAPVNAYGMTKALMEKAWQEAAAMQPYSSRFVLCRYGNVLGSRGSVLPFFRAQAKAGGPITVTDARMTRFWLTPDQAVDLVFKCFDWRVETGSILVPQAPASNVIDLAWAVAREFGLGPKDVRDIGIRPGEKLHEQLIHRGEAQHTVMAPRDLLNWGNAFLVRPATDWRPGELPDQYEYTSNEPGIKYGVENLLDLIEDLV